MRGIARGIVGFRWLTLGWAWIGLVLQRSDLEHPRLAVAGLLAATAVTVVATTLAASDDGRSFAPSFIGIELAVGRGAARARRRGVRPVEVAVVAVGMAGSRRHQRGRRRSERSTPSRPALGMALASFVGESILRGHAEWNVSAASKSALFLLAGLAAARVAGRLRDAEAHIASARARDEVARTLHDGVLQTLAVIQRRSDDDFLRALARDQERDLRAFLFGGGRDAVRPRRPSCVRPATPRPTTIRHRAAGRDRRGPATSSTRFAPARSPERSPRR